MHLPKTADDTSTPVGLVDILNEVLPNLVGYTDGRIWRAGGGFYFPISHDRETYIPDSWFDECDLDVEKVTRTVRRHIAAVREGASPPKGLHLTEVCRECEEHVYGLRRTWRETGCVTHALEWERILSSQGSLSVAESEALAEVRDFLETKGHRR